MRRNDREISDSKAIQEILTANNVCHIALIDEDVPYIVPLHYAFDSNEALYLHSAKAGRKIDIIRKNPKACFEVSDSIEVLPAQDPCDFSTTYRSVIGVGKIVEVEDMAEKRKALDLIVSVFIKDKTWDIPDKAVNGVSVLRFDIESITAKQKTE